MAEVGKWGYSFCGEIYQGDFDSPEEAFTESGAKFVGQFIEPSDPAGYLDGELLIEHIACQDEMRGDFAEDWPDATREQEDELTEMIQSTFREWMNKHDLQPTWKLIDPNTVQER